VKDREKERAVIHRLIQWAQKQESIRAMLLFSSRANPEAVVDIFSDYDILLAVTDVHRFHSEDSWLEEFGKVLVVYRNPIGLENGFERFGFISHYEEGVKIDYCFYPVQYLNWVAKASRLPDSLDNGYIVLLDKDRCTEQLTAPTYTAYLTCRPTEHDYLATIEEFFNDSIYVAKHLWRDNLLIMKHILDYDLKFVSLRKMLEWHRAHEHNWQVKPGAYGKGLKTHIDPEIWAELENTYVGAETEKNWASLFRTIDLFRKVATEVAEQLGYQYPDDLERRVLTYIQRMRSMDKQATSFTGLYLEGG
jgi:aminoglycoside 6-adenylyltransferase